MFFRNITIFLIISLSGSSSIAQILDDTTHMVYGAHTTMYLKEYDLRFNAPRYRHIDTTIFDSYKISKVEQSIFRLQNLGLEGTALRNIFYMAPDQIGVSPGFNAFNSYFKRPEDFRYYITRSPYSRMSLFLGGSNRSITDVEFSRNDSVMFNIGFGFKTMAIDKQIQSLGRGDKRVEDTQYGIYTQIRSKNLKYQLLLNFSRTRHIYKESGGVDTTEIGDFFDQDVNVFLQNARSEELRTNIHLYQQYAIKDYFEFYNSADLYRQRNEYISDPIGDDRDYYDHLLISQTSTTDSTDYRYFQYEFGLKGRINSIYYNGYIKIKKYDFHYKYAVDSMAFGKHVKNPSGKEKYLGFHAGYIINNYHLTGGMEYLDTESSNMYLSLIGKYINLKLNRATYKPSFLQQAYMGNHSFWINHFQSISADNVRIKYIFAVGPVMITPMLAYDRVNDYVYFDENKLPAQALSQARILSPGLDFKLKFLRHFSFESEAIYTTVEGEASFAFQIPELFINSRFFYSNVFYSGNLEITTGLDVNYKSAYYGYAYDPVVQQFYLQNDTRVEGSPVATYFIDFKINKVSLYLKMNNLRASIIQEGYMVAPLYPGLSTNVDFVLTWWFFD